MSIIYNSAVTGVNTPIAITGNIADQPLPATQPQGTIYIAVDTQQIYTQDNGFWRQVASVGGGGGSQNLDQVLTVGNNANGQKINLDNAGNAYIQYINGIDTLQIETAINTGGKQTNFSITSDPTNTINQITGSINAGGSATSYDITNTGTLCSVNLTTVNSGYLSSVEIYSEAFSGSGTYIRLNDNSGTFSNTVEINANSDGVNEGNIIFSDQLTGYSQYIKKDFNTLNASFYNELPNIPGRIATVNEEIIATNIDLSIGNYNCQSLGVYQIDVGDNVRVFDLTSFVNNGNNGEFVTICAADTPVKCFNSAGNIFGTPNINSKGLYKLMKIGNDIYSSHI